MDEKTKKQLDKYDWRHYRVDAIPKSLFPNVDDTFKDEEIVSVAAMSNFRGKLKDFKIGFNMPDVTALMLNSSNKAYNVALNKFREILEFCGANPKASVPFVVKQERISDFFDYLEDVMSSYVFAFSALEYFANSSIPDEYIYKVERGDKKCSESYNKKQIERNISLCTKISDILGEIYKVNNIKESSIWSDFKKIEDIRNKIIHLKSDDSHGFKIEEDSLWKDLIPNPEVNPAESAKKIIGYYIEKFKSEDIPRWYKKCPF